MYSNRILGVMTPTISKVRQNFFAFVEQAAAGEKVEFVHKGQIFQIVPLNRPSKLSRLRPHPESFPEGTTAEDIDKALDENRREAILAWERNNL